MGCSSSGPDIKLNDMGHLRLSINKNSKILNEKKSFLRNKESYCLNYKFIEVISKGKKYKVSKVLHLPTNQYRACKQLYKSNISFINGEEEFHAEIDYLSNIDHPNIPKLYEYFEEDICYYIILELASGKNILHFIETTDNFNERQVSLIMEQIFSCLNYLHSNKIIHQNIIPQNIILDSNKIGDFNLKIINFEKALFFKNQNISKIFKDKIDESSKKNYQNKSSLISMDSSYSITLGKLLFSAPENLTGKVSTKSDLWSCGILMYILLCGYPPFQDESEEKLIYEIKNAKIVFKEEDWINITQEAKNIITKILTIEPNKRLSAAEALKDPWITKFSNSRMKELENNVINVNFKIRRFSSKQKLEQATVAFIVHQNSSNNTVKQLRDIFKAMDKNGDGRLTYEELKSGYFKYCKKTNITEDEFFDIIKTFDVDDSQFIEFEEFLAAFMNKETLLTEKNLEYAFDYFDKDKSGKLSLKEIKKILGINNNKSEDALLEEIIKNNDTNKDGEISYLEFKNLMMKFLKK